MDQLPKDILDPLVATTVTREYCLLHPLKYIATKFSEGSPRVPGPASAHFTPVCLFISVAVGCSSELWIPAIKQLYRASRREGSTIHILSVWVIDRPNHGDAVILNRHTLHEHYRASFPSVEYGAALTELRGSGLLSRLELDNLVAIAHSGAGAAIVQAVPLGGTLPYRLFILIDGPFVHRTSEAEAYLHALEQRFQFAAQKMARKWKTAEEAVEYLRKVPPWNKFDDENLKILASTFFCPLGDGDGVTTKTPLEQRVASFTDMESALSGGEQLTKMIRLGGQVHYITATVQDLWPPKTANAIREKVESLRAHGLGLTEIKTGHHAPHENPELTAITIMQVLTDRLGNWTGTARL